jgi:hypothetical protein
MWGAQVALEMGDSYLGVEHAFLAMIRHRDTVPARALAGLADLDALEAAVLEAKNAPAGDPPEDAVFLPKGQEMRNRHGQSQVLEPSARAQPHAEGHFSVREMASYL